MTKDDRYYIIQELEAMQAEYRDTIKALRNLDKAVSELGAAVRKVLKQDRLSKFHTTSYKE